MDPLDRFVTCIIRDMKKNGFLDTFEKTVEFCIRKGFEMFAELTIVFLKDLIRKVFPWHNFQSSNKYTGNPILNIILKLIIEFGLTDLDTIKNYINCAINLLNKLLGRNMPEKLVPCRKIEITPNEPAVPVKSISNIRQKEYNGKSVYEPLSVTKTKNTSNEEKANIGKRSVRVNESKNTDTIQKHHVMASTTSVTKEENVPKSGTIGCVIGTARVNNGKFRGVERKKSYYIANVDLQTSPQDIIDHWKKIIPDGYFECVKLKCNGKRQSFKLTTNFSSDVLNPENWPAEVKVRPWVWKNKDSPNTAQNKFAIQVM